MADEGASGQAGGSRAFLDVALWGLAVAGGGFVLDVVTHLAAPGAAHGGRVLSVTPGHSLMALGAVMIAVGVVGGRLRAGSRPPRLALVVVALVSAAALLAAGAGLAVPEGSPVVAGHEGAPHPVHEPSAAGPAEQAMPGHEHGSESPDDDSGHRTFVGITEGTPTAEQRAAAEELLAEIRRQARQWENPRDARAAGYKPVNPGENTNAHWRNEEFIRDGRVLDPRRPEGLVYREGQLVGVFFRAGRGVEAPQPGGPLMVWHTHEPSCASRPEAARCQEGPKMLHAWFRGDEAAFDTAEGNPLPQRRRS